MKARVLILDDDRYMRASLLDTLTDVGYEARAFEAGATALEALSEEQFDLAITDMKMPGMDGIEFLAGALAKDPNLPVIVITAHGTVETAVDAMRRGAVDYILKPFGANELEHLVGRALEEKRLRGENQAYRVEERRRNEDRPILGESPVLSAMLERIRRVADSDATVLIRGETGSGKELVARAIHFGGPRADKPFLCVNCAALSAGLLESELFGHEKGAFTGADRQRAGRFELAEGGTLLLDEVSEIDSGLQAKLLRVLQEKEYERVGSGKSRKADVRVLATTNRPLEEEVRRGRFREDLFFRLNIVPVDVPPLRDRKDDVMLLANRFKERAERRAGKTPRPYSSVSEKALMAYHWPGNVRELENLVERAVLLSPGPEIHVEGLQDGRLAPVGRTDFGSLRGMAIEEVEKIMIRETLQQFEGHQKKSAESLGIGVRTLREKIKKWGLRREELVQA